MTKYSVASYKIIYLWAETSARSATTRAIAIIQSEEYTARWIAHVCGGKVREVEKRGERENRGKCKLYITREDHK